LPASVTGFRYAHTKDRKTLDFKPHNNRRRNAWVPNAVHKLTGCPKCPLHTQGTNNERKGLVSVGRSLTLSGTA
jgi:hypothetical protein